MNLEDSILSKISQWQNTNIVWFHLYEVHTRVRFIETENRKVVARGWGEKRMCIEFQFCKIKGILYLTLPNYTLTLGKTVNFMSYVWSKLKYFKCANKNFTSYKTQYNLNNTSKNLNIYIYIHIYHTHHVNSGKYMRTFKFQWVHISLQFL
jgi:hypothetical protein